MDDELKKIIDEPEGAGASDMLETAVGLGGKISVAGRLFPAPTAGALAMLEIIESPFVADSPEFDGMGRDELFLAVFKALYVLENREKAVAPILTWRRREEALERLETRLEGDKSPQSVVALAGFLNAIADEKAAFDAEILKYAGGFGPLDLGAAVSDISTYLTLAGGFSMLPDGDGGSKKKDVSTSSGSEV